MRVFRDDLAARGIEAPESKDVRKDPAWMAVLNEVYGFPQPDLS